MIWYFVAGYFTIGAICSAVWMQKVQERIDAELENYYGGDFDSFNEMHVAVRCLSYWISVSVTGIVNMVVWPYVLLNKLVLLKLKK